MPRGPTVYTLPPGTTPQLPNTVIPSATFNAAMDDIATTFNTAQPIVYGGTGAVTVIGGWDALNARGTDIATAATVNLTTATGPNLHLTGTTTVTAITLAAGAVRFAMADAAFQLTASATLIVNGSSSTNYTTSAGDLLIAIGDAGSVARVWFIGRAVVTLNGTQTLTNKTLTSPVLTGPVVTTTAMDLQVGQIAFPATQNPSANANTLDDYEEGTWTPTVAFGGASVGITYSLQNGKYTKIGNIVNLFADVIMTAKGSSTGAATVEGLPFTASSSVDRYAASVIPSASTGFTSLIAGMGGYVLGGATTLGLRLPNTVGAPNLTDANFSNTSRFSLSASYVAS